METHNNMAIMPTARDLGAGVQTPLSPPDTSFMESYVNIFDMLQGNTNGDDSIAPIADDNLAYQFDDNESSVISPHHTCDNAVDPSVYFTNEQMSSTRSWTSSPFGDSDTVSAESSPCTTFNGGMQNAPPPSDDPFLNDPRSVTPDLARQRSLNVVMEVLGTYPVNNEHLNINSVFVHPSTPSSCGCSEDDILSHPSPSYAGFSAPMQAPQRNRVFSDFLPASSEMSAMDDTRTRAFSMDNGYLQSAEFSNITLPFENYTSPGDGMGNSEAGSPGNDENNNMATITSSPGYASSPHQAASTFVETTSVTAAESMTASSVEQHPLGMSENSLISLLEFMAEGDPTLQAVQSPEDGNSPASSVDQACSATPETVSVEIVSTPTSTPAPSPVIDLTDETPSTSTQMFASVPTLERTASYKRKRTQNNKSCRESRKKRRLQRDEAEKQVAELTEDNDRTRRRIKELEEEVEQTRSILMGRLSRKV